MADPLTRLTDFAALERLYGDKTGTLETIDAAELAAKLKAKVIGQDEVIDQIAAQLSRRIAQKRKDKPLAVFCFAGAPGVGKTYLGKVLAEAMYSDKTHFHQVEMAACDSREASWSLFGSRQGYSGGTGSLTSHIKDVPDSVILLDEFEKAVPEIHKRFLSAWNDGFITDNKTQEKIDTKQAIFILTTNAAARRIGELARDHKGTPRELSDLAKKVLQDQHFAPEVVSRIDYVFAFREMKGLDIARVVALEIEKVTRNYELEIAESGIDPTILLNSIEKITKQGMEGGVREITRDIEENIADGLIDAKTDGAKMVRLEADGNHVLVIPVYDAPPSKENAEQASASATADRLTAPRRS